MQLCDVTVLLAGAIANQVKKFDVTPAEILILRAIHGDGSIDPITPTKMDRREHAEEKARLADLYSEKRVEVMFPGFNARLPVSLSDIGISNAGQTGAAEPRIESAPGSDMQNPATKQPTGDGLGGQKQTWDAAPETSAPVVA